MLLVSNLEKRFVLAALEGGSRLDERRITEFREVAFDFDESQRGHVTVHLGQSKVLAVVTATATRPYPERPAEGIVSYYVAISSLACGTYEEASYVPLSIRQRDVTNITCHAVRVHMQGTGGGRGHVAASR